MQLWAGMSLHFRSYLRLTVFLAHGERSLVSTKPKSTLSQRTLEDLDWYFDFDSPHRMIIPNRDKVAKQRIRPVEFIKAEVERIAVRKSTAEAKGDIAHVESVNDELWRTSLVDFA